MKALVLDGSERRNESESTLSQIVVSELKSLGYDVYDVILYDTDIASCTGCFECWVKTPGICVINDAGRDLARKMIQSELMVFITPVTFGGYSSELKKALDRLIPNVSPFFMKIKGEVHHEPRYDRYPRLIGVGILPHPDEESERIFKTLVGRNAVNFHCPADAALVVLENQGSERIREEVKASLTRVGVGK